jgi:general secretion pathway protein F
VTTGVTSNVSAGTGTIRYRYRAATSDGQVVEGVLQASSRQTALAELHRQRLFPVAVDEVPSTAARPRGPALSRHAAVALWTRNVSILLGAGVPLDRALAFTADQAGHAGLADAVRQTRRAVQGGSSLADALAQHPRYFGALVVSMVAAGESSGALDVVFERMSEHLEEVAELRSQVRSALLYPALMAVVASLGVAVLLLFVVPRFATILGDVGGRLPATTRLLVAGSEMLTNWWWAWLIAAAALGYGAYEALRRPEYRRAWHRTRLSWPRIGELELKYVTARFTRTLGLLLRSGVPMLSALRIARGAVPNIVLGEGIERAAAAVAEGSALAPALAGTLPSLAVQMLAVGEESGRLEELCVRVADTYDAEVRRALRTTVAMIEPAMILIFGALVGFVALAMLQAIYSINTTAF